MPNNPRVVIYAENLDFLEELAKKHQIKDATKLVNYVIQRLKDGSYGGNEGNNSAGGSRNFNLDLDF